jgi:pimeloyl-ACP methyl ester carboxylesterase
MKLKAFRKFMWRALLAGLLSFLIVPFLIPFESSGTMTASQAEPNAEFVEAAGLQVRVERAAYAGDCGCKAPLIVLMHGFGASTFSWREVIQPLTEFGEVLAYDRPAFGLTDRPTEWSGENPYGFAGNFALLDDLVAQFGDGRRIVLVGHSAGGQLAAEYARQRPTLETSLVLVDAAIMTTGGDSGGLGWFLQLPQMQKLGPMLVAGIATSGDDLLEESYYNKAQLTQAVYDGYHKPLKIKGWEQAFYNFTIAPRENELKDNLSALSMPTLVITGEYDTVVPASDATLLQQQIAGSVFEVIADSAHLPQEEQPVAFMKVFAKHWALLNP